MMTKPKILLVDDKLENLIALERLLADLEIEFVRAQSGNQAIIHCLEQEFALALIDVQMPEMDGFETLEFMRQEQKSRLLPVIFVSAIYSEDYYKIKGIETGAVDFITKPIIPEILRGKVRIFLSLYLQRKELENALRNVKVLRGLLPICASCKKIRDDKGFWNLVEVYIRDHTEAEFSHGICPDCIKKLYPEYAESTPILKL
jgi:CheY-like chemotaxis protein